MFALLSIIEEMICVIKGGVSVNEAQKKKRNFRQSKEWKTFRQEMKKKCGGLDYITGHKLRKGFQVHHRNLDETKYTELEEDNFICINNLTHKVIHWLWTYYKKDPAIIDRIKKEMIKMAEINGLNKINLPK